MAASFCFLFFVILGLIFPSPAEAHGLAVYASTPVTPPKGWLWLPVLFVVGFILWDWFVLRKTVRSWRFLWQEFLALVTFLTVFLIAGFFFANMNTAPPPGLGLPHRPFYGMSVLGGGIVFLFFNVIGLGLFILAKRSLCKHLGLDNAKRKTLLRASAASYIVALLPYVAANAMTHGWAGSYVNHGCARQLAALGTGLARYAQANDGRLPQANTFEEMLSAVRPHVEPAHVFREGRAKICAVEDVLNRKPRPYVWNAKFSGASLSESQVPPSNEPILRCPAIHDVGQPALYFTDLLHFEESDEWRLTFYSRILHRELLSGLEQGR